MYEFVRCHPASRSTPARMALTALRAGYDGVVLRNPQGSGGPEYDVAGEDELGVEVYRGVDVRADSVESMHGAVGSARARYDVVCVRGGSAAVERAAASSDAVDVVSSPREFDHVTVREAAEHGVALEFDLAPVLRSSGGERVSALRRMRLLLQLCRKYDAAYVVSASPRDHLEVRGRRELRALCGLLGLEDEEFEGASRASRALVGAGDVDLEVDA